MNFLLASIQVLVRELRRQASNHPHDSEEAETFIDAADSLDDASDMLIDLAQQGDL